MATVREHVMAGRRAERSARVEALAEGRKVRAVRYKDRRKEASREACRRWKPEA
jgi:hypothetical protein